VLYEVIDLPVDRDILADHKHQLGVGKVIAEPKLGLGEVLK
jgi:hypothetical protein